MKKRKANKKEQKRKLQESLGLKKANVPLFVAFETNRVLEKFLEGIEFVPMQLAIFSQKKKSKKIEKELSKNKNLAFFSEKISPRKIMASSNAIIVFDEDKKLLSLAQKNKSVPIMPPVTGFADYNPKKESGNAFLYEAGSSWSLFSAIVRAVETYKLPYDWYGIVRDSDKLVDIQGEEKGESFVSPFSNFLSGKTLEISTVKPGSV